MPWPAPLPALRPEFRSSPVPDQVGDKLQRGREFLTLDSRLRGNKRKSIQSELIKLWFILLLGACGLRIQGGTCGCLPTDYNRQRDRQNAGHSGRTYACLTSMMMIAVMTTSTTTMTTAAPTAGTMETANMKAGEVMINSCTASALWTRMPLIPHGRGRCISEPEIPPLDIISPIPRRTPSKSD